MTARLAGLGIVAAFLAPSILPAAPANKPPRPVSVVGPVQVEGAVETVNDALRQPYFQSIGIYPFGESLRTVSFPIPAGKRLIIESITFRGIVPQGQTAFFELNGATDTDPEIYLAPQFSALTFDGFREFVGTYALRLRFDAPATGDGSIVFTMNREIQSGTAYFSCSLSGYLVDL